MNYRIDLHTHSKQSPDGSIDEKDYQAVLKSGKLDFIAITDHNTIEYAIHCQKKLGQHVIVGEEISTQQGHLIGLFLHQTILPGKDVLETAREIKSQGGLVYAPHAYDIFRHGIGEKSLKKLLGIIDILEVYNGRMIFPYFNHQAKMFAFTNGLLKGYGSDAHISNSLGQGALILSQQPTQNRTSFKNGTIDTTHRSMIRFFGPTYSRMKKLLHI